ncbi:MAG: hypothetical protein HN826_14720 [Methylococcales bacterium]|jgi:hypothetical protein|nr:hypothetical protein [Methylococcales bacterium]
MINNKTALSLTAIALILSACAATEINSTKNETSPIVQKSTSVSAEKLAPLNNDDLYETFHDGRTYVFDDFDTFQMFLKVGETAYRKVFITGGNKGETLVFGLTSKDKKKSSGIASIDLYFNRLTESDDFYGEYRNTHDNRIYVFSTLNDMQDYRKIGDAIYRYTDIGAGPNGQTVVYVLNKKNKKNKPVALIANFKKKYHL